MKHPYIWSVWVPIIISTLLTLFGPDIRLAFSTAARSGGHWYRRNSLLRTENLLALIDWLHGNSYNILLWLFAELRIPVAAVLVVVNAFVFSPHYPNVWPQWGYSVASLGAGAWFGAYIRIFRIVELLERYAQSKEYLAKRIAELKNTAGLA
jgi:hypothetical protein